MSLYAIATAAVPPVHLLAYSALIGTELYQTFVMTKVAFQALPRSAFTSLQKRVFPIYFQSQSLLLLVVAATSPPHGPVSLIKGSANLIPFAVAGISAGLNLVIYGPRTKTLMIERAHQGMYSLSIAVFQDFKRSDLCNLSQRPSVVANRKVATRDAKLHLPPGTTSNETRILNKLFSRAHAISIHLNLVTIGATLWYGWNLASRMQFGAP